MQLSSEIQTSDLQYVFLAAARRRQKLVAILL